ncbi:hypothetical protein FH972_021339 [Carpinus fangiana]|uniref:mRNA 5'-phosphatase n=1 Tax=Carpinus fangiana TaxID=176857 RepID=A0A5N6KPP2_9ROSI|nr:hypothetical protein FH972_021339 [Carpinus fangiana]
MGRDKKKRWWQQADAHARRWCLLPAALRVPARASYDAQLRQPLVRVACSVLRPCPSATARRVESCVAPLLPPVDDAPGPASRTMNIHSLLNDKADENDDAARRSASSSSRPPLPLLSTASSSNSQHRASDGHPFPQSAHSMSAATPPPAHARPANQYVQTPMSATSPGPYAYLQQGQPLQSPYTQSATTPGTQQAQNHYFAPRPSHSSQTPSSALDYTPLSQQRSPMSPYSQPRPPPPQHQSSYHQPSHPGTPLGPPPSRGSAQLLRESPQLHHRRSSGASYGSYGSQSVPQATASPYASHQQQQPPPSATHQHAAPATRHESRETNGYRAERNHSMSVSPKTVVTDLPARDTNGATTAGHRHPPQEQITKVPIVVANDVETTPPGQMSISPANAQLVTPQNRHTIIPSHTSPSKAGSMSIDHVSASTESTHASIAPNQKRSRESSPAIASAPPAKRPRVSKPPPIWAQRAKAVRPDWKLPKGSNRAVKVNGPPVNGPSKMVAGSQVTGPSVVGPLGPWEPTITNVIPFEPVTREISNFLWTTVVQDQSTGTGEAGGVPSSLGQFEIEARLGHIIDPKTHQRLHMPYVRTETALDPSMEVAFESQMTEKQHEQFNNILNEYLADSLKKVDGPKQRIPMRYAHTREVDVFYELPDSEISLLPPVIQTRIRGNRARKPKMRVTKDQKTGAVLAKIVKVKIQDMHVFDPRTDFDWRISVNAEMNWDGDIAQLTPAPNSHDRRKDRMSYKHLAFQIDLTQVTSSASAQKTHELEIELASSEVRKQGLLTEQGQPSGFEELIQSFVNNVRVLSRRLGYR